MTQLTEHFSLEELTESDTALRLGINNTPLLSLVTALRKTAELGEMIRSALSDQAKRVVRIFVTSGYRCEALEKVLCEKDYAAWRTRHDLPPEGSWALYFGRKGHPKGRCMDFKAPDFGTPYQIVKFIASRPDLMEHIDQIIMEGKWVHVAWSASPRHEVLAASFSANGTPSYTKEAV